MRVECPQCGHEHAIDNIPTPQVHRVNQFVQIITDAEKPLTEQEIADRADVSRPTVAKYRELVKDHPDVKFGDVGRSTAYWPNGMVGSSKTNKGEGK